MKIPRLLHASAGLALLLAPVTQAQEALPEARAVIDRYLQEIHWDKLAPQNCRHETSAFEGPGIQGTVENWSVRPDLYLSVLQLGGFGAMRSGFDGSVSWISGELIGAHVMTGTDGLQQRLDATVEAKAKPASLYEAMRVVAKETFEGQPCYRLEIVARAPAGMDAEATREARTTTEFYAVDSGLLLGTQGVVDGDIVSGPVSSTFSEYKEFGGVLFPTKTRVKQGGIETTISLKSVEFSPIDKALFVAPPEVKALLETTPKGSG